MPHLIRLMYSALSFFCHNMLDVLGTGVRRLFSQISCCAGTRNFDVVVTEHSEFSRGMMHSISVIKKKIWSLYVSRKTFLLGCLRLLYMCPPFHFTRMGYHSCRLLHHLVQDHQSIPKGSFVDYGNSTSS